MRSDDDLVREITGMLRSMYARLYTAGAPIRRRAGRAIVAAEAA